MYRGDDLYDIVVDDSPPVYFADDDGDNLSEHEHSMSFINDFMINFEEYGESMDIKQTLNTYWIHSELKEILRNNLKKYSLQNFQFFQLRRDYIKLCQLPIYYNKVQNSCISLKTFIYAIPSPSNPYALRNNIDKLTEIYQWNVGKQIAKHLMTKTVKLKNENKLIGTPTNRFDLIVHFETITNNNKIGKKNDI